MTCRYCAARSVPHGRNRNGTKCYRCRSCNRTFSERRNTIGNRYTSFEETSLVATLLAEGSSMGSTARVAGVDEVTVSSLLAEIGESCETFLSARIRNFDVSHLEVDETWTFVRKKQKHVEPGDPRTYGDAYTFIALDRATRCVVAWLLGNRDSASTAGFILNVRRAVSRKPFQVSSDGWEA